MDDDDGGPPSAIADPPKFDVAAEAHRSDLINRKGVWCVAHAQRFFDVYYEPISHYRASRLQ